MQSPPKWLVLGLLLCFVQALWMGMVMESHYYDKDDQCHESNSSSTLSSSSFLSSPSEGGGGEAVVLPTRRQPWPFLVQHQQQQKQQHDDNNGAGIICSQKVIFVGLEQAETSIVGTIATNLRQSCKSNKHLSSSYYAATTTNNNNHSNNIIFTQEPLSSVLFQHQEVQKDEDKQNIRLVAFLRNPAERATAAFFRWISIHHLEPTDQRFKHFLMNDEQQHHNLEHYYLRQLSWKQYPTTTTTTTNSSPSTVTVNETNNNNDTKLSLHEFRTQLRSDILQRYDFLGTTKRMLESLVLLKMLWGLSWQDILFLPSDDSTFFLHPPITATATTTNGWNNNTTNDDTTTNNSSSSSSPSSCIYLVPMFTNAKREDFLQSARWKRRIAGDVSLYGAVNARLDATIDMLGYDAVQDQIQIYQRLLKRAIDECWTSTTFPCSANGDLSLYNHSCIEGEWGCGHECLKQLSYEQTTTSETMKQK